MKTASSREAERAMDDRREHDSVNVSNIYTNAGGSKPRRNSFTFDGWEPKMDNIIPLLKPKKCLLKQG